MLRISERGIAFIKRHEGFVARAQWDYAQYSIGYGSHCNPADYPNGITIEEADKLLRLELEMEMEPIVAKVERTRGKKFAQCEWDALASLTYNLGSKWASNPYSIYKFVIGEYAMDEEKFIATFEAWSNAGGQQLPGLLKRRTQEARLYLYGDYSDGQPYNKDEEQEENEMRYNKVANIKNETYKKTIVKLINLGYLTGKKDEDGNRETTDDIVIDLGDDAVRLLVVLDRAGVFDEKPAAAASDVDLNALGKVVIADVIARLANG